MINISFITISDIHFIHLLDIMGAIAFVASGVLIGIKKHFDLYGLFVLGAITGFGGGFLRDIILGRDPVLFQTEEYIYLILIVPLIVISLIKYLSKLNNIIIIADAIGIGVYAVIGCKAGFDVYGTWLASVSMGLLTATGGGMIRDIFVGDIPFVLRKEIYATPVIFGALIYFFLLSNGLDGAVYQLLIVSLVVLIRLITYYKKLSIPRIDRKKIS